jgi:four helix bundle protein
MGSEAAKQRGSEAGGRRSSPSPVRTFRDLVAWQRAMELAEAVYRVTALFSSDERFGLTSQLRRAAVSIPSNIAEGFGRQSRPEYLRYLRIARGSLAELGTQIELACRVGLMQPEAQLGDLVEENARILSPLIRALEAKERSE